MKHYTNNTRYARIHRHKIGWVAVPFYHLKAGDTFRIFEEDDTLVVDENGDSVFRATSDAYFHNKVWTVEHIPERCVDEAL